MLPNVHMLPKTVPTEHYSYSVGLNSTCANAVQRIFIDIFYNFIATLHFSDHFYDKL